MKTLLLPLFGDRSDVLGLSTAAVLARAFNAHLDLLHVRSDPAALFASIAPTDMGLELTAPVLFEEFMKQSEACADRARQHYEEFCRTANVPIVESPPGPGGPSACWREAVGSDIEVIAAYARFRDLLVVANADEATGLLPGDIGLLLDAGRPLLLAGPRPPASIGRRIAIAWKVTAEAARAVGAAMPLLARAERIFVFSIEEDERTSRATLEPLVEQLRWHRLPVEGKVLSPGDRSAPEALLAAAGDAETDLIVMGAYGHSRVREMVFGGFTRHMLRGTRMPVFMLH